MIEEGHQNPESDGAQSQTNKWRKEAITQSSRTGSSQPEKGDQKG